MIRRFGEPVRRDIRYRLRPGAYAILMRGSEVLLTFQSRPMPEFQLPGGGVDPGEHPGSALHREVREETGWAIGAARRLGAFRRFTYMPEYGYWAEKLCHIYIARPTLQISAPTETHHAAVWMPLMEAANHLGNAGDRHFVRTLLRARALR